MNKDNKIFIAGHNGMVGRAVCNSLKDKGYKNLVTVSSTLVDLTIQQEVNDFFKDNDGFDAVIDCAAKVGGIHANNTYRADFIYRNLQIQNNLIHTSHLWNVDKFLFLGSSCIYPKFAEQPIKEEYLLTSPLEYTNEPYSIAKIAGIKMCESYHKQYGRDYISVMPCNQYGPYDNFHPNNSHVLPALLRRFHEAKGNAQSAVNVWGTGKAKREFMHVDDLASACIFILENVDIKKIYDQKISHINIGSGVEHSIEELVTTIKDVVKYEGEVAFDLSKPDGTMRKLMDSSRLNNLGWTPSISLEDGLKTTYDWYVESEKQGEIREI
jgi:GDP-L-fucose synthase|tara:strand:+ start:217 stop:1191 length:975 start_codon:yes stop_codon:yes gene_type:complete